MDHDLRGDAPGCALKPKDSDLDGKADRGVCEGELLERALDCDDSDPERAYGREERCDGIDNDCDELIDEGSLLELGGLPPDYPTPPGWAESRYLEVCQLFVAGET